MLACLQNYHYSFTFGCIRSPSAINSDFPFPARATPFISEVDTPLPIPRVKTLKYKQFSQ